MMKTILVTGANGFLGQHLCIFLKKAGYKVIATGKGESRIAKREIEYISADLTNEQEVKQVSDIYNPAVIIHNAAMSKPDECEKNKDLCLQCNVDSTKYLLETKPEHFIYISTDFVFGEDGPHSEDAVTGPLNFYGESKLKAEKLVEAFEGKSTIVRPVFIYGEIWEGMRPTFLHWVKNNLVNNKTISVVSDQKRTPTFVTDICLGIEKIIEKQATGVYNLAGKDQLSPYEMAVKLAETLNLDSTLISSVTSETFTEPVKRAKRSGLKIEKAVRELDYCPVSFNEGVRLAFGV